MRSLLEYPQHSPLQTTGSSSSSSSSSSDDDPISSSPLALSSLAMENSSKTSNSRSWFQAELLSNTSQLSSSFVDVLFNDEPLQSKLSSSSSIIPTDSEFSPSIGSCFGTTKYGHFNLSFCPCSSPDARLFILFPTTHNTDHNTLLAKFESSLV
ncbi:hypothetical protein B566_EDAN014376 [Ephemera danica]|nr:hypothetical protein B566_EDAN014376 [Ephemera danica]